MSLKLVSRLLSASAFIGLMTVASSASALNITPAGPGLVCTTNSTAVGDIEADCGLNLLTEVYKQDVGGGESGSLAGSYTTTFANTATDPQEATIVYNGGSFIDCTAPETCYLLVKDGNATPAAYVFNLTGIWDGKETLNLSGFWPTNGAISHVSLYGGVTPSSSSSTSSSTGTTVGEPGTTALALLGVGMIGLALRSRRRKAA